MYFTAPLQKKPRRRVISTEILDSDDEVDTQLKGFFFLQNFYW